MFKRKIYPLIAGVMLIAGLAACGDNGNNGSDVAADQNENDSMPLSEALDSHKLWFSTYNGDDDGNLTRTDRVQYMYIVENGKMMKYDLKNIDVYVEDIHNKSQDALMDDIYLQLDEYFDEAIDDYDAIKDKDIDTLNGIQTQGVYFYSHGDSLIDGAKEYTLEITPDNSGNNTIKEEIVTPDDNDYSKEFSPDYSLSRPFNTKIYDQHYSGFRLDRDNKTESFITPVEDETVKFKLDNPSSETENIEITKD